MNRTELIAQWTE